MLTLEKAAADYRAAVRALVQAQDVQDRAFETQAEQTTYGTVQAWQDAVAHQRRMAENAKGCLHLLAHAAMTATETVSEGNPQ